MGEWRYNSIILTLGIRWEWVISITHRPLYTRHPLGGAQSRSRLVEKIQLSCSCREQQPDSSVIDMASLHIVGKHAHTLLNDRKAFKAGLKSPWNCKSTARWQRIVDRIYLPSIEFIHELSSTNNKYWNCISTTRWQKINSITYGAIYKIIYFPLQYCYTAETPIAATP
jgi:hypothetical protein